MMMGHSVPVFDPDMNPQMQPRGPRMPTQPHDQNGDSYVVPISRPYNNNNNNSNNPNKRKYSDRDNAGQSFNHSMRENNDENFPEGTSKHYFLLWKHVINLSFILIKFYSY
jgi:hypothetical protein